MAAAKPYNLVPLYHFKVTFEGLDNVADVDTRFSEVTGLNVELKTEEIIEAGENRFAYKVPTRVGYPALVLKRGLPSDNTSRLIKWATDAIYNFEFKLCSITVALLDEQHQPLKLWKFSKAYPVKINWSDPKAQESGIAIETLEITYQTSEPVSI